MSPEQKERLEVAAKAANLSALHTGCPAALTLAQWALESGWGAHQPGNNCFGIKAYVGCFGRQQLLTTEYIKGQKYSVPQWFAVFPTLYDCFEKHAELIASGRPYQPAFERYRQDGDFVAFVHGIAEKYATDPSYADKLLAIIAKPEVQAALQAAQDSQEKDKQDAA